MKESAFKTLSFLLVLLMVVGSMQTGLRADSVEARQNRIVGVWDAQVTLYNCSTGAAFATFRGLHKYELGGTAQVVPATNPTALSAHVGVWNFVEGNNYKLAFKMFRFDGAGNNIGWQVVRFDIVISDDGTTYAGSGQGEVFDSNGNSLGKSCPTFTGTRFQ